MMRKWASSFNLNYSWVLHEALNTLWLWHTKVSDPTAHKLWNFHKRYSVMDASDWTRTFTFTHVHDDADYLSLSRDALWKKALHEFEAAFEAHYNYMRDYRFGPDWKITGSKESDKHFIWTAFAVVRGLDAAAIAEMNAFEGRNGKIKMPDRTTVSKAIVDVTNLIDIPSPLTRGRPKKQPTGN